MAATGNSGGLSQQTNGLGIISQSPEVDSSIDQRLPSNHSTPGSTPPVDKGEFQETRAGIKKRRESGSTGKRRRSRSRSRSSVTTVDDRLGSEEPVDPNSPGQIYRNILVMEESLRQQYISMAVSRRKHVIFFCILVATTAYYTYACFFHPSIYRLFNIFDRLLLMTSVIMLGLFYLTGLYTKTFVYGPKFIFNVNKGLRPYNLKLVKVTKTWSETLVGLVWSPSYMERPGRLVKIVLWTRAFSSETIQTWESYRMDIWDREYLRLKRRKKQRTKQQ